MKPFNIKILEGFIIHDATVAADAFITQDIDATARLLSERICSLWDLIYLCPFSRPVRGESTCNHYYFNITPQQIFHLMVGFVIYCCFFIVSTPHLSFWAQFKQTTIRTLAFRSVLFQQCHDCGRRWMNFNFVFYCLFS